MDAAGVTDEDVATTQIPEPIRHDTLNKPLRIGIDGRAFQSKLAGTGRYILELCRALDHWLPRAEFFIYSQRPITLPAISERWQIARDHSDLWGHLPATVWYIERGAALAQRDGIDVFWGAANFLPKGLGNQGNSAFGTNGGGRSRKATCKSILTVHDLVPQLYPQTMSFKHRLAYKLYFARGLAAADRLVTNSQGTKQRLQQTFGRQADAVVYPCAGEPFQVPSQGHIERIKVRYGLKDTFLLAVATLEPRKNLGCLVDALLALKSDGRVAVPELVLVGQIGWKASDLLKQIEQARSRSIGVIQTGFVPNEDLPALYAGAKAFIFPSLYEGFGMPVLEALTCGARVLASDIPEIREAGGSSVTYMEPSTQGITQALRSLLAPPPLTGEDTEEHADSFAKTHRSISVDQTTPLPAVHHASTWHEEGRKLATLMASLS